MSGPSYPNQNPAAGSNAIGSFQIGVSPIGTIPPYNPWVDIISQYANSPVLTEMILAFNEALDQTANFDNLYDFIWNIQTAQGYGLDVLGRIVNVTRSLSLPGNTGYIGFDEATGSWTGFGQGGWFSGGAISTNFLLADGDFRTLIYAKAAGNISDGSIPALNKILLTLFPYRGACYVVDNMDMSMVFKFGFPLNAVETAIIEQKDILPVPVGVKTSVVIL